MRIHKGFHIVGRKEEAELGAPSLDTWKQKMTLSWTDKRK